MIDEDDCEIPG